MITEWRDEMVVLTLLLSVFTCACSSSQPPGQESAPRSTAAPGVPPNYQGFLEYADCSVILGWAYNASDPDATVDVDVFAGTAKLGAARAELFRQDLVSAGKGNGRHAFRFPTPASIKDGQTHSIQGKVAGSDVALVMESPKSVGPCEGR